jgi:ribosomal protein S5
MGSKNEMNLAKATFEGLVAMRTRRDIADMRGVEI